MQVPQPFRRVAISTASFWLLSMAAGSLVSAEEKLEPSAAPRKQERNAAFTLKPIQSKQLDRAVDEGLAFLATQQEPDGSFKSELWAQPAVTSFCVMAFLSRGHMPGQGPYGQRISRAVDFVLSTQQRSGLFFAEPPSTAEWMVVGTYNHAIAGVMMGEVYGMAGTRQQQSIRTAIQRALEFTRNEQVQPKNPRDRGAWRYLSPYNKGISDLSVTAWHLMFYRSAKNAEFDVPAQHIDEAVTFVERCFEPNRGTFSYALTGNRRTFLSRSMAGAGIVSLALAGKHDSEMAQRAGQFILEHPFDRFNRGGLTKEDRFYYGAYYCSQAMFQLGGKHWEQFYPVLLRTMVENQRANGSWDVEANQDAALGHAYSTSLAILSLTPPYQLLPIYQR